jgi:SDR family mycofactocin-dependent oxidoreductase
MTRRLEGKVALVSGGGRGQGRSHALRLAEEGAAIIAFDICEDVEGIPYEMATPDDLRETERLVKETGRPVLTRQVDVRDLTALEQLVKDGAAEFGALDIVCANAGISHFTGFAWEISEPAWETMIAVNLTGVWKTVKAAIPTMLEFDNGGSIVITSSTQGIKASPHMAHYVAAKHGLVGLMRALANELADRWIRVNTIHPTTVNTSMAKNDYVKRFVEENPQITTSYQNALPVGAVESWDISNAVVWLASDESRYVTGISLPVDAGYLQH